MQLDSLLLISLVLSSWYCSYSVILETFQYPFRLIITSTDLKSDLLRIISIALGPGLRLRAATQQNWLWIEIKETEVEIKVCQNYVSVEEFQLSRVGNFHLNTFAHLQWANMIHVAGCRVCGNCWQKSGMIRKKPLDRIWGKLYWLGRHRMSL